MNSVALHRYISIPFHEKLMLHIFTQQFPLLVLDAGDLLVALMITSPAVLGGGWPTKCCVWQSQRLAVPRTRGVLEA